MKLWPAGKSIRTSAAIGPHLAGLGEADDPPIEEGSCWT